MTRGTGVKAAEDSRGRYSEGYNCAQAVIRALQAASGVPAVPESVGAGFTTGIGGSGCVCGALAGGVAVLGGYAAGLGLEPAASRLLAEELSADLHTRFTDRFGAACCRVIKRGAVLGSDEWMAGCAGLTEETAAMVVEIIAEHGGEPARRRFAARDTVALVRRVALGVLAGGAVAALLAVVVAPRARPATFASVLVLSFVASAALETGGSRAGRASRALRALGAAVAGVFAALAVFAPEVVSRVAADLLSAGPGWLVAARGTLALAAVVLVALAAFSFKRYR